MQIFKKNDEKQKTYFCGIISLWIWWKSPWHAFTSPSCSLREKSSLSVFRKCGEPLFTAEIFWQKKKNCYKPTSGYLNTASKFLVLFMSCLSRFSACNNNQSEICIQYIKCSHWMMIGIQIHISHLKVLWLPGPYYGYLTLASNVFCEIIICKVKRSLCLWINRNN